MSDVQTQGLTSPVETKSHYLLEGAQGALPIILGYLPVGLAYGALAGSAGLSFWETVLMSIFVYAGSAQFVAVALIAACAGELSIVITTFFINLRHLLMSASLSQYFSGMSRGWLAWFGFELTDESFAIHSMRLRQDAASYRSATILAANGLAHLGWVTAGALGFVLQKGIADPGKYGLDFALPAMFIALLLMQLSKKLDILAAVAGFGISLILGQMIPVYWAAIIAAMVAAAIGAALSLKGGDQG